jgi:hypothetical protein
MTTAQIEWFENYEEVCHCDHPVFIEVDQEKKTVAEIVYICGRCGQLIECVQNLGSSIFIGSGVMPYIPSYCIPVSGSM